MKDDNRRKTLKALAVGAPVVWVKPVVDSMVLPAHGSTSPCAAAADCYNTPGGEDGIESIEWGGVESIAIRSGADCSGNSEPTTDVILSRASDLPPPPCVGDWVELASPDLPEGCSFWICLSPV